MSELTVGAKAPAFSAPDQTGKIISLADFAGETVILYFYPKDDTPGCTTEACSFRDNHDLLIERGINVLGVGPDDVKSHAKFAEKFKLPFPLLADAGHKIADAYACGWRKACMAGNTWASSARPSSSTARARSPRSIAR